MITSGWISLPSSWVNVNAANYYNEGLLLAGSDWRIYIDEIEKETFEEFITLANEYNYKECTQLLVSLAINKECNLYSEPPSHIPQVWSSFPIRCNSCENTHDEFLSNIVNDTPHVELECTKCSSHTLDSYIQYCPVCEGYQMAVRNHVQNERRLFCTICNSIVAGRYD